MVLKGGCPPDVANQTQGPGSARRSYARKWPLGRRNRAARGGWSEKANEIEVSATPICNTRCYMCPSDVAIAHLTFQFTFSLPTSTPTIFWAVGMIYFPCLRAIRDFASRMPFQPYRLWLMTKRRRPDSRTMCLHLRYLGLAAAALGGWPSVQGILFASPFGNGYPNTRWAGMGG